MSEPMLAKTKEKLEMKVALLREKLKELEQSSVDAHSGDAWHSSSYRILIAEQDSARAMLIQEAQALDNAEVITFPLQNEVIELGHVVQIQFLDDDEFDPRKLINVHILGPRDTQFIHNSSENDIVVSNKSPLGRSLIGHRRSEEVTYLPGLRAKILAGKNAIEVSGFFNNFEP